MDLGVCGAIAPYNELLGGKLVAAAIGSREARELYKSRYNENINSINYCF